LIVSAAFANTTVFLTVFGYSLAVGAGGVTSPRTGEVAGTSFAGGPASLAANNATRSLAAGSLPGGAATMYADGANATVVAFSYGDGEIVFLGWDWFGAAPVGTQDGGWLNVLNRAVAEVAGTGCTISGTPGPDTLVGTGGSDRICARGGTDTITAGGGSDVVFAGEGGDTVNGQGGHDSILLAAGNDVGFGGPGKDRITGGPGRDRLNGTTAATDSTHVTECEVTTATTAARASIHVSAIGETASDRVRQSDVAS
jgi:Ca2+-binding RTX toxin-like protein